MASGDLALHDLKTERSSKARRRRNATFRKKLEMQKAVDREARYLAMVTFATIASWFFVGVQFFR